MNERTDIEKIRDEWTGRQRDMGNAARAVLMKGVHWRVNQSIDRWHRAVMRAAFKDLAVSRLPSLDIGCGYGRLADAAKAMGMMPIGIDFTHAFCVGFSRDHGPSVCGSLDNLPFENGAFGSAYSVTSLMYLTAGEAQLALQELDRCLAAGATILVLEPSLEFNALVRRILRRKRHETLTRPGFSLAQMGQMAPTSWQVTGAGSNAWMTLLLPLLVLGAGFPPLYRAISWTAGRLDRPHLGSSAPSAKWAMYRWISYLKP